MIPKKDVKTNLLNHSQAKVHLLGKYLEAYLSVICNNKYIHRIKIFDLFCSEGLYQGGGEGSPLIILKAIRDVYKANQEKGLHTPKMDCHFNDLDSAKVEKVKRVISERSLHQPEIGEIDYSSNDYQIEFNNLLQTLPAYKNQEAFIFIDPYEYKHIKASQIKSLLAYKNSEVLLWLPTQHMYRFSNSGTPLALKDFIEELVPYTNWKESDSVWHFIEQLKVAFQRYIGDDLFVDTFTIQKDVSTVFCLFFFSTHIRGFEKMLETKWTIDTEQGKGWEYTGNHPTLFHDVKTNPLEDKLTEFMKGNFRTNGEIYAFTLRQGFLPRHTNEILKDWESNDRITITRADNTKPRKSSFYVAYEHYKQDYNKVSLKLK